MSNLFGFFCLIMAWGYYLGSGMQWRKVWRNNVRPTIPLSLIIIGFLTACSYSLWGAARNPTDWWRVASFFPSIFVAGVMALQFVTPRPSAAMIGSVLAGLTLLVAVATTMVQHHLCVLRECEALVAFAATTCSVLNIVLVMPSQVWHLCRRGTVGSSAIFNSINLAGFVAWLGYGVTLNDKWLIGSQSVGVGFQALIVVLHFVGPATKHAAIERRAD